MISRIWHGWTTPANANRYQEFLRTEIFTWIAGRGLTGFRGIDLLRRDQHEAVEFVTILWFDSLEGVREFAGEDYERAVVLPEAQALLARYDERSSHYEVVERRTAGA
jgi:antibiotic biosynthesis monooxygenase (ABM) superfamily enzyme